MYGVFVTIESFKYVSQLNEYNIGKCLETFETEFAAKMWLQLSNCPSYPIPYPTGDDYLDNLLQKYKFKNMSIRQKARNIYDLCSYRIHPHDKLRLQIVGYGKDFKEKKY